MSLKVEGNIGSTVVALPEGMSGTQLEVQLNQRIGRTAVKPLNGGRAEVSVRLDTTGSKTTLDILNVLTDELGCREI
ncbi:MAG: hypothetical protein V1876_04235 [Candidatus Peregrinibacteria bacterium]